MQSPARSAGVPDSCFAYLQPFAGSRWNQALAAPVSTATPPKGHDPGSMATRLADTHADRPDQRGRWMGSISANPAPDKCAGGMRFTFESSALQRATFPACSARG